MYELVFLEKVWRTLLRALRNIPACEYALSVASVHDV
jgi:hypothetical protein